jgi:hypothetical protein
MEEMTEPHPPRHRPRLLTVGPWRRPHVSRKMHTPLRPSL